MDLRRKRRTLVKKTAPKEAGVMERLPIHDLSSPFNDFSTKKGLKKRGPLEDTMIYMDKEELNIYGDNTNNIQCDDGTINTLCNNNPSTAYELSEPETLQKKIGCPISMSILLSAVVITPSEDREMRDLCDSVMLSLSQFFIFCQISVYTKEEYSFGLGSSYCDICIVYTDLLTVLSLSFPNICCSGYTYSTLQNDTIYDDLFCRFFNILKQFSTKKVTMFQPINLSCMHQLSNVLLPLLSSH